MDSVSISPRGDEVGTSRAGGTCTASGRSSCVRKIAAVAAENGARDRFEQYAFGVAHPIGAQQIGAAGPMLPGAPGAVLEHRRELRLHLVQIADRVLVDDHDVGAAAPSTASTPAPAGPAAPAAHLRRRPRGRAGSAGRRRWRAATARAGRARSTRWSSALARERAVRAEHPRRQPLEQHGLVGGNAQMPKAALGVRHRQRERARSLRWDRGISAPAPRPSRDPTPCRSRNTAAP